jgi:hypothetical protein
VALPQGHLVLLRFRGESNEKGRAGYRAAGGSIRWGNRTAEMAHVLTAYRVYARLLGAKEIRIMHPINDEVRDYYVAFGYTYLASKDYLFKQVLKCPESP